MIIGVGDVEAHCPGCGGVEFASIPKKELRTDTELTCSACGRKSTYHDLLEQIGERAMKQANASLAKLRGRKDE
jgi:hypothetical protein